MIIQDLSLNQDNYTFSLEKANPSTQRLMEQLRSRQMVFSAVTVNNRLSSLKPVNSSSIEASRISPKPLDAKQSVSGQVPCFLPLGCSPAAPIWGTPLPMVHMEGRCDPFTISFLPSFFGTRMQRSLSFQIRKIAWFYLHDWESL